MCSQSVLEAFWISPDGMSGHLEKRLKTGREPYRRPVTRYLPEGMGMIFFTREQLHDLMQVRQFPCVTFYLPVEKTGADTRAGAIILRNMLKNAEDALKQKGVRTPDIERLLAPVHALLDNALFWEKQNLGLALFVNDQGMTSHRLPIRFAETLLVADRFLVRPLLSMIGQDGRYAMLALGLSDTRLYRCTRHTMMEGAMTAHPDSLQAVLDSYDVEKQMQHHSGSSIGRGGASGTVFHGFDSMKDSEKDRIREYFRKVDASLRESLTDDHLPVVLVCVDYLAPLFRSVSKDPRVQANHISGSPDTIRRDVLLEKGWEVVRPIFEKDKNKALSALEKAMGSKKVTTDVRKVLLATQNGQVDTLFLQHDRQVIGLVDRQLGSPTQQTVEPGRESEEELLDFAAMRVMSQGGKVFVLTAEEMPEPADCIGLLRYEV